MVKRYKTLSSIELQKFVRDLSLSVSLCLSVSVSVSLPLPLSLRFSES